MSLDTTNGNRHHRRARLQEVRQAERRKLLAVGEEFERLVVLRIDVPYATMYSRFLQAYVATARGFNKGARLTEVDAYWFRNRYKNNWRLRLRRWWHRVRVAARLNPLPA